MLDTGLLVQSSTDSAFQFIPTILFFLIPTLVFFVISTFIFRSYASNRLIIAAATVNLTNTSVYTLDLWMREDGLRIDQLLLTDDPNYEPPSSGLAESPNELITSEATNGYLSSWTIDYNYDPLQRLTSASYSGDISATFKYTYDPVGNMTAYTETVATELGGADTRHVTRYFNDANEMIAATDSEVGTTSYTYDLNGNLTQIIPPSLVNQPRVRYDYDQRNLMVTSDMMAPSGSYTPRMAYGYDGNGQRLSMADYGMVEGQAAQTTTFTNDVSRLSQVLLSDDGNVQTAMLYGADLIGSTSNEAPDEIHFSLRRFRVSPHRNGRCRSHPCHHVWPLCSNSQSRIRP